MPWETSRRRERLPSNWPQLVKAVRARSGGRCEFLLPSGRRCPRRADGGVDHKIPNDDHSMSNLRDSCKHHHGKKSSAEGLAAREANKPRPHLRFGQEPHPRSRRG
jgi:hypothetical protein